MEIYTGCCESCCEPIEEGQSFLVLYIKKNTYIVEHLECYENERQQEINFKHQEQD